MLKRSSVYTLSSLNDNWVQCAFKRWVICSIVLPQLNAFAEFFPEVCNVHIITENTNRWQPCCILLSIENGCPTSQPSQMIKKMMKTLWNWARDVAFSVSLLLMLPSAISFCKLLNFVNQIVFGIPINVKGNVVLITGASSGIGKCIAHEYAKRGAKLVLVARREQRLEEVAEECKVYGAEDALVCPADLTNPDDCKRIVDFTIASFGRC